MALGSTLSTLLFFAAVVLPCLAFSATNFLHGKVSCTNCPQLYDYSGIRITISCENTGKHLTVTANKKGEFTAELASKLSSNCVAELQGGPSQLYASRKNIKSKIVKPYGRSNQYVLSSPLIFSTSYPSSLGSSKTIDLPLPPEWGLAPTSYYFPPFFPIIGIP